MPIEGHLTVPVFVLTIFDTMAAEPQRAVALVPRQITVQSHVRGMNRMILPMSWGEWAQHDGTALAALVRKGEVKPSELAAQAAAGITKVDPALSGVVEVFEDVIADPAKDGTNLEGWFAGLPFLM